MDRTQWITTAALTALLAVGAAGCSGSDSSAGPPSGSVEAGASSGSGGVGSPGTPSPPGASGQVTSPSRAIVPGTIPGTGRFRVGAEIPPGTYVSNTAAGSMCYAARLRKQDSPDPLIANYVTTGRTVVTIEASDVYFESRDCADWTRR